MGGFEQRILLAEDDRFLRKSAGAMLLRQGFIVMAAEDGEEALRLARTESPDLILLDVILPKMQGFDVLRALKSDPHTSPIPVIILSNLGQESDSVAAREMGALDYWVKSNLPLEELAMRVGQAISTSRDHRVEPA
jgi:two-component system, OmpR family, alkaline phosphatase synthesis response regulator PhoP